MSKRNVKRVMHTQKEEKQAKRIMIGFGITALVLLVGLMVLFTLWG